MPRSQCSLQTITTTTHNMYLCNWLHSLKWYTSQIQRASRTKWVMCHNHWFFCLRNAFDMTIRQTIKSPGSGVVLDCIDSWSLHHYLLLLQASATRTTLRTTDGMVYYSSHQSSIHWNNSSMHWIEIFNLLRCKVEWVLDAVSGFTNPFSSSFEDNEL